MCTCTVNQRTVCRLLRNTANMKHSEAATFARKVERTLDLPQLGYFFKAVMYGKRTPNEAFKLAQKDAADRPRMPARQRTWRVPA